MCKQAVDFSNGSLVEISLHDFGSNELLAQIADSSRHLKRLKLVACPDITDKELRKSVPQFTELELLEISYSLVTPVTLVEIGRCCPQLKTFKLNDDREAWYDDEDGVSYKGSPSDYLVRAIAQHMHNLHHLQLFGDNVTNRGLPGHSRCLSSP